MKGRRAKDGDYSMSSFLFCPFFTKIQAKYHGEQNVMAWGKNSGLGNGVRALGPRSVTWENHFSL